MKPDSFNGENSYGAGSGCPVQEGSRDAEEDSNGCHKQEWMVWPYYSSSLLCIAHETSFKLEKVRIAHGNLLFL